MSGAPWPVGTATGIGSMPGTDPVEAARFVFGELPDLPYLPELPARGAGADMIGRGAGLLVDMPAELVVSGWRLARRPGLDSRRTADLAERDLDALTEAADGYVGALKVQVAGPWTLASAVELPAGERLLSDRGALAELVASLTEGVSGLLADVRARVPGASPVLQLDEPALPAVLAGSLRSASGFRAHPPVEKAVVVHQLRSVLAAAGDEGRTAVHCCADSVPFDVLAESGATAVSLDVSLLDLEDAGTLDALGALIDGGTRLLAGVLPGVGTDELAVPGVDGLADRLRKMWRRLGFAPVELPARVTVTPACGLASASEAYARAALARCQQVAARLGAEPE